MSRYRILKVFNRYLHFGGEELSVEKIHRIVEQDHDVIRLPLDSREWTGAGAPGFLTQAVKTIYNAESRRRLESAIQEHRPDFLMMHNIYPVGSPSLYHAACRTGVPVIQFAHNYRPFSVGGTLFLNGRIHDEPLRGKYWSEIRHAVWQQSVLKSAVFAVALKLLHRSGWLRSVKAWICVSEFMRDKFIETGLPKERVHGLRHAWEPMAEPPPAEDKGYYLFISRLVDVKGVRVLLEGWDEVSAALGKKAPELLVAGEGPMEGMVRAAAARNPKVRYVGMVSGDAKREVLRCCRAVMIPSLWWEPLGLVACESYDYGKPVIAAASGGLTETVQDGITGFLHEATDEVGLMREVVTMEALPAERRALMGAAGRRWLLENTTVEVWKRRFEEIVNLALEKSQRSLPR